MVYAQLRWCWVFICEIYESWEHRNVTVIILPNLDGSINSFFESARQVSCEAIYLLFGIVYIRSAERS